MSKEGDGPAYADSAYPSPRLPEGLENQICEKAKRSYPLTEEQKANNTRKARIRCRVCRVEHVFAGMEQMVGGISVRCKSLVRATFDVAMLNLAYNMRRQLSIERPTENWTKRLLRQEKMKAQGSRPAGVTGAPFCREQAPYGGKTGGIHPYQTSICVI